MNSDGFGTAFQGMIGCSPTMHRVFERIRRLAAHDATVLLTGESGTGKELAARALHEAGPRRLKPFVAVNCAALPHDLIESELFGHKRGAFSGAATDHLGLFRAAAGGTLLLDEVSEMKLDVQAKLLRVLQEHTVRPVGTVTELPVDMRIIASTNRDLQTAMAQRLLRQDLYYRLCVHVVPLPPLREHSEDIPLLVSHYFAVHMNGRLGGARLAVTSGALDWLQRQSWPGNVRELFNTIERAAAFASSGFIGVEAFTPAQYESVSAGLAGRVLAGAPSSAEDKLFTLKEAERVLIRRALQASGDNKVLAARLLGISRKTLYKKLGALRALAPKPAGNVFPFRSYQRPGPR